MEEKNLKMSDLLNTSQNADGTSENKGASSNYQLVERVNIDGTPFQAIRVEGYGCCARFGNVRITDWVKTMPEVMEVFEKLNWHVLIGVVIQVSTDVVRETLRENNIQRKAEGRTIEDISRGGSADVIQRSREEAARILKEYEEKESNDNEA